MINPGNPIDPFVCPRGHHSIKLSANRIHCRTCRNQGRDQMSWDRSEMVDLRKEDPPLKHDREIRTDGGSAHSIGEIERDIAFEEMAVINPFRSWASETVDDRHFRGGSGVGYALVLYILPFQAAIEIRSLQPETEESQ